MRFKSRSEAGKRLGEALLSYKNSENGVVLALPRGGLPVGYELAKVLNLPLDAFLVRKLGVPGHEELAIGAIALGGVKVMNENILGMLSLRNDQIQALISKEKAELDRRNQSYRQGKPALDLKGRVVLIVDDGLATGATMYAAVRAIKKLEPQRLIVALPVVPRDTIEAFRDEVDEVVCLYAPEAFSAVGQWYEEFSQLSDEEAVAYLR